MHWLEVVKHSQTACTPGFWECIGWGVLNTVKGMCPDLLVTRIGWVLLDNQRLVPRSSLELQALQSTTLHDTHLDT